MTTSAARLPVLVVLGATGTGKSKLALEIAKRFKGEIISADSMQVYKGLDIITNKITPEEASEAPHHLLGFLDPLARFTVTDFRNAAIPLVDKLLKEGKVPVVVGGTNYYIESLLWHVLIDGLKDGDDRLMYERDKEVYGCGGGEMKRDGGGGGGDGGDDGVKRSRVCGHGGAFDHHHHHKCQTECNEKVRKKEKEMNKEEENKERKPSKEDSKIASVTGVDNDDSGGNGSGVITDNQSVVLGDGGDGTSSGDERSGDDRTGGDGIQKADIQINSSGNDVNSGDGDYSGVSGYESGAVGGDKTKHKTESNYLSDTQAIGRNDCKSGNNSGDSGDGNGGDEGNTTYKAENSNQCDIQNNNSDINSGSEHSGVGGDGGGLTVWQETDTPTEELYQRLQQVDPEIAETYHPNERRKIIRSLQVWEQMRRPHSELLREQRQQEGGSGLGGRLRYPHALILWVTCEQEVLLPRLDARVDEMIERGLLKELLHFHTAYNHHRLQEGVVADYTKGIFQSIGFKEFHDFLVLTEEERGSETGCKLYEAGVTAMKLATRQYTKRQLRWIKNRFITPSDRKVPPLYILDATDPGEWDAKVWQPAEALIEAVIEGRVPDLLPANPQPTTAAAKTTKNTKTRHECEVCGRVLIGEQVWLDHLHGAKHRKMLRRRKAMEHQQLK